MNLYTTRIDPTAKSTLSLNCNNIANNHKKVVYLLLGIVAPNTTVYCCAVRPDGHVIFQVLPRLSSETPQRTQLLLDRLSYTLLL